MSDQRIIDPFHRSLRRVIDEKLELARTQLEEGAADQYDRRKGYIRALKDVIDWADEVERDQYGRKPDEAA